MLNRLLLGAFALGVAPEGGGATARQYKKVRSVTLPLKSLKTLGDIAHVRITTPITVGKKLQGDDSTKEPAHLCNIIDLDTGEEMQMIIPKVLRSTLEEEYPTVGEKIGYLGKCFEIENLGKKAGRGKSAEGYNTFRIVEVEPVDGADKADAHNKRDGKK